MSTKKDLQERMNRLAVEWYNLPEAGNEGVKLNLEADLMGMVFQYIGQQNYYDNPNRTLPDNGISSFYMKDFKKFNPQLSPDFSSFLTSRMTFRAKDDFIEDHESKKELVDVSDTGDADCPAGTKTVNVYMQSLDAPVNSEDGESVTLGELLAEQKGAEAEDPLLFEARLSEVLTLALNIAARLHGRAKSEDKINYFRLFFTDRLALLLHTEFEQAPYIRHERDMLAAMKLTFLDFFQSHVCRTVEEISRDDLKLYSQLVEGRPDEQTKLPLPNDVYVSYLARCENKQVGESALSNQKTAFAAFLKEQLC